MSRERAVPKLTGPPDEAWLPATTPVAAVGCEVCASYVTSIRARKRAMDDSGAGDYRVLMARHLAADHSDG